MSGVREGGVDEDEKKDCCIADIYMQRKSEYKVQSERRRKLSTKPDGSS
jgi:hypothetical protein